ncbi:MAG TPA: glutathione S-transferase, partial [Rhodospirillaceae bacterium]|nr:glutathione S-transferase [Rhodospirillaceae bacterium]
MMLLYHLWLSPHCRKVRLMLGEKQLPFETRIEKTWDRDEAFLAINPTGEVPVLVDEDGNRV